MIHHAVNGRKRVRAVMAVQYLGACCSTTLLSEEIDSLPPSYGNLDATAGGGVSMACPHPLRPVQRCGECVAAPAPRLLPNPHALDRRRGVKRKVPVQRWAVQKRS